LIYRSCGAAEELYARYLVKPLSRGAESVGFEIRSAVTEASGACRRRARADPLAGSLFPFGRFRCSVIL